MLDNTSNNNITLIELSKSIGFDLKAKRLRYIRHILNLIAKAYLYGQDVSDFEQQFNEKGLKGRRELWRSRGELRKLYNLMAHVMASGKRLELFTAL
jgi:hypothetical protein